jgi:peptide-methionine (S)-S-oxide reductase
MKSFFIIFLALIFMACTTSANSVSTKADSPKHPEKSSYNAVAYFASGCFWCVEAIFESVKGVSEVESGYAGGTEKNPTYELIGTGKTRYAEAVKVYYDSTVIAYEQLLIVFFDSHNPETLNQQGPDRGPQYRSAIFYNGNDEKKAIQKHMNELRANKVYKNITTEVSPLDIFYVAEDYHQNYERNNPTNSYVRAVSIPRIEAFKTKHPELLKK